MGFEFNPRLYFVCNLCKQTFPGLDKLKGHKLQMHLGDCLNVKCIVFEEKSFDYEWIPTDQDIPLSDEIANTNNILGLSEEATKTEFQEISSIRTETSTIAEVIKEEPFDISFEALTPVEIVPNLPNASVKTNSKTVSQTVKNFMTKSAGQQSYNPNGNLNHLDLSFGKHSVQSQKSISASSVAPSTFPSQAFKQRSFKASETTTSTDLIPLETVANTEFLLKQEPVDVDLPSMCTSTFIEYEENLPLELPGEEEHFPFSTAATTITPISLHPTTSATSSVPVSVQLPSGTNVRSQGQEYEFGNGRNQDQNNSLHHRQGQDSLCGLGRFSQNLGEKESPVVINSFSMTNPPSNFNMCSTPEAPGAVSAPVPVPVPGPKSKQPRRSIINLTGPPQSVNQNQNHDHSQNFTGEKPPSPRPFMCHICYSFFRTQYDCRKHIKTHSKDKPFKCPHCPVAVKHQTSLERHMIVHGRVTEFNCKFCGKSFHSEKVLGDHERTHTGERPFKCQVGNCHGAFFSVNALTMHIRSRHSEELGLQQFVCPICGKAVGLKYILKRHLKRHRQKS